MKFINWDWRPAVLSDGRAGAVLADGEGWTEVDSVDVFHTGGVMSEEYFRAMFGELPPLPAEATMDAR